MITRKHGYLRLRKDPAPDLSAQLEQEGWAIIPGVLSAAEVSQLGAEIAAVFEASLPDRPNDERNEFRHGMLNRSALAQQAIANPAI